MKIDKVVIVGGGSSGWMTAATLIKAFPEKEISVIESKDVPTIGVGESTIGGIKNWTRFIGINEKDFFPHTDASIKMAIKFTDFYKKDFGSFYYPFGLPFKPFQGNVFTEWHFKKYFYPETPTEDFTRCLFPASFLYENNKFSLNKMNQFDNFDPENDTAYHFDATKFGNWLKEKYCIPNGINHIIGTVNDVKINEDGIEYLILDSGEKIFSDLYIDCTGFKSLLLGKALKEPFDSYSDMLPNNRAWATRLQYKDKGKELEGFTNCTAIENGWCWNVPLWSRIGVGYVYSDEFISSEGAKQEFKNYLMSDKMVFPRSIEEVESLEFKDISMRVGIHQRTFVKNVVAIGLSAGFIEPLESNGLFSVHEFLFKLIHILQRGKISQFDRDMYNRSTRDLFDSFTKFVIMHYSLSHRNDTEYWKSINKKFFSDKYGDPNSQIKTTIDWFYDMGNRYLDMWTHPEVDSGITYVSTGLQMFMMNEARVSILQSRNKNIDLKKNTEVIIKIWEQYKNKWSLESKKCPTIEEFLKEEYYKE